MKGFTLIEMLCAFAVIAIISVIGGMSLSNFNKDKALDIEVERVLSLIIQARSFTLSSNAGSAYGIHFEERKVVMFKGASYSSGASSNKIQLFNNEVKISATSLTGGGVDVVFKKLTGATAQSGTITVAAVRNASQTKVITIESTGMAYSN